MQEAWCRVYGPRFGKEKRETVKPLLPLLVPQAWKEGSQGVEDKVECDTTLRSTDQHQENGRVPAVLKPGTPRGSDTHPTCGWSSGDLEKLSHIQNTPGGHLLPAAKVTYKLSHHIPRLKARACDTHRGGFGAEGWPQQLGLRWTGQSQRSHP